MSSGHSRHCEGYGVCSDVAQQHFAFGKMLGGRSAVKKACGDFLDKLKRRNESAAENVFIFLFQLLHQLRQQSLKLHAIPRSVGLGRGVLNAAGDKVCGNHAGLSQSQSTH